MKSYADLVPMFMREFQLCKLQPGEVVAILTEPATRQEYADASAAAAAALGAQVFEVSVPGLGWNAPTVVKGMAQSVPALARPSALLNAVKESLMRANFIVDLITETVLHVPVREEIQKAGARILTILEPADTLERMFPTEEIKNEVLALRKLMAQAKTLRLTSRAGTDLRYDLIVGSGISQYGMADVPGRWDHWPSALVSAYPAEGGTNGTLILSPGDIVYPFKRYIEAPVRLVLEGGYVRKIEGGLDAALIQQYLESWDEPEVFAASHIGIGMHPRAQWSAMVFADKEGSLGMDGRSMRGGFIFSTGPNRYTGRDVEAHLDIPLRECTVELDGVKVVVDGKVVVRQ